ncbi:hypothetical protein KC19_1G174400 [Ceratodon purpureus]|uniref:Uncharacterized protein n=1 Tax=Ceratodon purpureus TaxID=3225 RepID=A0A8T0J842_CERPU|nr:hypothetical protein KC19_1G174400 [Ceratodon purpureus]
MFLLMHLQLHHHSPLSATSEPVTYSRKIAKSPCPMTPPSPPLGATPKTHTHTDKHNSRRKKTTIFSRQHRNKSSLPARDNHTRTPKKQPQPKNGYLHNNQDKNKNKKPTKKLVTPSHHRKKNKPKDDHLPQNTNPPK